MALVPCRECGKEVSDEAKACPNCGLEDPGKEEFSFKTNPIYYILGFLTLAAIGYSGVLFFRQFLD